MKEQILLISGCSHAAGSEIDGSEDSTYNRQHTFGNLLANKMNRRAINLASNAANNQSIARTTIEWFSECYDPDTMDVFVLVAWTESSRIDLPMERYTHHEQWNPASDYISKSSRDYIRVNLGYKGYGDEEKLAIARCHEFMVNNLTFIEIISANLILQLEYFFKSKQIDYIMCNTMHMFSNARHLDFYTSQIDKSCYLNLTDNDKSFYWKYKNAGHTNNKAKYWHHGEIPHQLFSEELYTLYNNKYNIGL